MHLAVRLAGEISVGHGRQQRTIGVGEAGHGAQCRPDEELVGDEGRHGIPRQAEDRGSRWPERPEGEGLRRPDGDLHPAGGPLAQLLEHHLHQVAVPHADAAARDQRIAAGGSGLEGLGQVPLVIPYASEVDRLPTVGPELREEARAVGVADLARSEPARSPDELVARRDDPHPGSAVDQHRLDAETRQHPHVCRRERGTRSEDLVADRDVVTGAAHVGVPPDLAADHHRCVTVGRLGVLDHRDGIGAGRHRCTGHDAGRLAGAHRHGGAVAGHDRVDDPQPHGGARGVLGPDGIAVHRRVGEGRNVLAGPDRLRQDMPG